MNEYFIHRPGLYASGGICLLIGALGAVVPLRLYLAGVRATAVVVGYEGDSEVGYDAIVEYEDLAGARHRQSLRCSQASSVGMIVEILYDPVHPTRASGGSFADLWGFPLGSTALGVTCVALALFG